MYIVTRLAFQLPGFKSASQAPPWDSHRTRASGRPQCAVLSTFHCLDLLLQGSHRKGFHDGLCWLCLDLGLLAKHHPHACLGGWLRTGLDFAEAWQSENAVLLHLLTCNGCEAVEHLGADALLQLKFSSQCLCQSRLGHCFLCASLHRLLHGWLRTGLDFAEAWHSENA